MLNPTNQKRVLTNIGMQANLPMLKIIAFQYELKLSTPWGFRIARAILNKAINEN